MDLRHYRAQTGGKKIADQKTVIEATLTNMDQGVIMYDANLKIRAFNDQARELWGFPQELLYEGAAFEDLIRNLVGRNMYGDVDVEEQVAKRIEGVRITGRNEFETPDGRILELRRRPLPDGGFVSTQTDITELKQAQDAIVSAPCPRGRSSYCGR